MVIRFIPPNSPPQFNKIVQMESGEGNGRSEQKYKCYFATKVSLYCALKHKIMSQESHYKSKIKTTKLKLLDSPLYNNRTTRLREVPGFYCDEDEVEADVADLGNFLQK